MILEAFPDMPCGTILKHVKGDTARAFFRTPVDRHSGTRYALFPCYLGICGPADATGADGTVGIRVSER